MTEDEEKDIDLIEAWYKGTLSADELATVQQRIANDPVFAEKLADFTDVMKGIRSHEQKEFSETVAGWENEIKSEKKFSTGFMLRMAAALLFLVVGSFIIFSRTSGSNEDLYAKYFEPYEDVINVRGDAKPLLSEGMSAYNQKDYNKASDILLRFINENGADINAEFYLGIASLEAGKTAEGLQYLHNVITGRGLLIEQAQWYYALGLLKSGDVQGCKYHLEQMNLEGHDYRERAASLLEDLK